jgi:thiamine phosphate synthase YjbQ (UPF0047 family)
MKFKSEILLLIFFLLVFLCCQIQGSIINDDNNNEDSDIGDVLRELFPNQQNPFDHQQYRRASLRYHPHVVYKKASLKPIIGHNGKFTFIERAGE